MICRACGSSKTRRLGRLEPYLDYSADVYACHGCGCRFCEHDADVHERLHATGTGGYAGHVLHAQRAAEYFNRGDVSGLRRYVCSMRTLRHVVKAVEAVGGARRVVEFGCSRGTLSSYFILAGYQTLGVDVSATTVEAATRLFGPHFVTMGSARIEAERPFDAVVHTGTIGCVASPLDFTRMLLDLLRPGGVLAFNSPNVAACRPGRLWIDGATPPDLVTLFDARYWQERFGDEADVSVYRELESGPARLNRMLRGISPPPRRALHGEPGQASSGRRGFGKRLLAAGFAAVGRMGLGRLLAARPTMYGMMVTMIKRQAPA